MLGPINAVAKLKLNPRPESDVPAFGTPKVDLFVEMQKLAIGVTRAQYQRLITVADGFGAMTRGLPYRKYRPHERRKFVQAREPSALTNRALISYPIRSQP